MQAVCPITDTRINERVARLNALSTLVLALLFISLNFIGGLVFLMLDFGIRGFIDSKYSPICQLNKWLAKQINLSPKMINAGPKIFAAQVGFLMATLALIAVILNFKLLSIVLVGMLSLFSFLEMAFGFCVACQIYPFIRSKNN